MHFPGELKSPSPKLCQQLHLLLKKRRVSAQLDALERLIEFYVTNMENESLSAFAAKVSHLVSLYGSRNMILSLDMVEKLIENILKDSNPQTTHSIRVIDTFRDIPIPSLGSDSNTIYLKESPGLKVFDTPENMLEKYKIRYKFLLSRALECKKAACLEQGDPLAQFYKEVSSIFTPIQNLNNADHFHTSLFGMLGKLEGDQYFIEDETGYVALDLTETSFQDRIYTPGCITMADGEWNGQVFRVTQMQMPPLNASLLNRMELKTLFQGNDYPMNISESQQNQIIIMLSDIWLDHESVLNKLEKLFRSFHSENICPNAIVFMGNFLSPDEDQLLHLKNGFQHLASLLQKYISNEKCQLIFVPGPNDPGIRDILPKPPILDSVLDPLRQSSSYLISTFNPVRLICQDTTFVLYRDDINKKFGSQSIFPLSTDCNRIRELTVETLLDQGHLCPLPIDVQPVFWHHEQSLWLFPPPSFLVLGYDWEPFQHIYGSTKCFGTGSFALEGFFLVYESTKQNIQICQIET